MLYLPLSFSFILHMRNKKPFLTLPLLVEPLQLTCTLRLPIRSSHDTKQIANRLLWRWTRASSTLQKRPTKRHCTSQLSFIIPCVIPGIGFQCTMSNTVLSLVLECSSIFAYYSHYPLIKCLLLYRLGSVLVLQCSLSFRTTHVLNIHKFRTSNQNALSQMTAAALNMVLNFFKRAFCKDRTVRLHLDDLTFQGNHSIMKDIETNHTLKEYSTSIFNDSKMDELLGTSKALFSSSSDSYEKK